MQPGDFNQDKVIDAADIQLLINNWGCMNNCPSYDLNGDGLVGVLDLYIVNAQVGMSAQ